MLRAPVAALLAMVMLTVRCDESTKVVELTVILVPENVAVRPAPFTKFVPITVTFWFAELRGRELGLVEVTVGAASTVKQFVQVAPIPSGFVTVKLLTPVVVPAATETFRVM